MRAQSIIFQGLLLLVVFIRCNAPASDSGYLIKSNGFICKVFLKNISDSLNIINADTYSGNDVILASTWKLEYPVFHFECGDANNDSIDDILVGVIKPVRFDSIVRKRIFIFKLYEGYIRPLWLGSRVSQPLEDFRLVKTPDRNIIRTIEKEQNGNYLVAEYKWRGFGLDFIQYMARDINLDHALTELNK